MKSLLLTLSISLTLLPVVYADEVPAANPAGHDAIDDLPPPREAADQPPEDLPPPRTTTRKPRTVPADSTAAPAIPSSVAPAVGDLPPASPSRDQRARGFQSALKYGFDDLLVEAGWLPHAREADVYHTLRASPYLQWQPSRSWEFRAGARLDGMYQDGGVADHDELLADYTDTYVRYRNGDTRLTLGAQTIIWGRADEIPLADRVSRADVTRLVLDDLPDRRRAQLAARWEQNFGDYKLDTVWLPLFRGAQVPDHDSVWSPINRTNNRVLGIDPALTGWVGTARIAEDEHGSGGAALRLTKTGEPFDFGVTLARTRQSLPYYLVAPGTSLTAIHPFNNFLGADMELVKGGITWRMELGYTDNVPATLQSTAMDKTHAIDWIGAMEFFPGGKDTRINLQLVAHALQTDRSILELKEYYGANGEIETSFGQGRWKAGVRFFAGLNVRDVYVNPKVSYVGWEPHEIYIGAHYFDGATRTIGGFHEDHSLISLGLRTKF